LTPKARARQSIDGLLVAAGWAVQDLKHANFHVSLGVAIREFQFIPDHGYADLLLGVFSKRLLMGRGVVSRISSNHSTGLTSLVFKIGLATNGQ
jgi:hypothetical protein